MSARAKKEENNIKLLKIKNKKPKHLSYNLVYKLLGTIHHNRGKKSKENKTITYGRSVVVFFVFVLLFEIASKEKAWR